MLHRALLLVCVLMAAATLKAVAVDTAQHNPAATSARYTQAASAPRSPSRHLLESASAAEIALAGCQLTGFTLTTRLGSDAQSPPFQLLLDTTLPSLFVADSTIQCSRASNCAQISPKFDGAAAGVTNENNTIGTVTTTYPDGSKWSGTIYAQPAEIRSSAAAADSAAVATLPSLRFASLTSVLHSARGDFFRAGSCAAPADATVTSYQGVAGFARGGGVAAASAVSVATAAEADSLWEQIRTRSTPLLPSSNAFTLSLCANSGRLWLGTPDSAAEHDRFLSSFASQMRFVRMHAEYTGLFQIDVQSITVQPRLGSATPAHESVSLRGVSSVLDSASSHWIMPGAVFDAVQRALESNAEFTAAFPNLNPDWWVDRVCVSAASGMSAADLYHSLPRLVLMTDATSMATAGFGVSVGAVGSYLVPCDAERTLWAAGITRRDESVQSLQSRMSLGWPFLNHFVIHFDVAQQHLGFAASTACWEGANDGGSGGSSSGGSGWDGAGSSGAMVLGGWAGSCGTGAALAFVNPECAPRWTANSTANANETVTHCAAITLSPAEQEQGWTLGSCGAEIAEGSSCQLGCAPGYTAEFSTAFWCERSNHTQAEGALALSYGTQFCLPLAWEPLDPALPAQGSSAPAWTVPSDYPVQLNWSAPAIPFPLQVDLVFVDSDSGRAPAASWASLVNSTMLLAAPTLFSQTDWSNGPTLLFRAPNVTSASIFRVQASMGGRAAGATLLLKVLPMPLPPPPPLPEPESSTADAESSSGVALESSTAAESASSSGAAAASSAAASSSAASIAAVSSTAAAAAASSSTGVAGFDPRLVAASVSLDTSLLYSEVHSDESLYLASLLAELSSIVPGPRVADLRVEAHSDPVSSAFEPAADPQQEPPHARFSFVIQPPLSASEASSEPSVDLLVEALTAAYPAPHTQGLVTSKITRVSSVKVSACDDGSYKLDCAAAAAQPGVDKGPPPPATDRSWIYAVIAVAATLALVFCCCILLRGRTISDGSGSRVRVTTALPSTHRGKAKSKSKKSSGKPAVATVRKHEGERFTIVDNSDDLDDLDAFEDEEEMEMEELPTEDRSIDAVSIAINEPASAQQSPRPPSPSRYSSPRAYGGAPDRIAPPPASLHHDDPPDFEMDAASDDEDELNQL